MIEIGDTDTLQYSPPSHGDWGIVRIAALVPESHMLFVCPSACGRHGALGAIQQGFKDRLSYIYIDRSDIIRGYAETIKSNIPLLLEALPKRPKAIMIYVSCLDDLIGTDLDSLRAELEAEHGGIRFRAGHMNPISLDSAAPPPLTTQSAMFSFLETTGGDKFGINLIGNLTPLPRENDLLAFLDYCGAAPIRHMSDFDTFEGFQQMAKSRANLVLSPIASLAAREMERKHGQPFAPMFVSYDLDEIAESYGRLAEFLRRGAGFDFSRYKSDAEREIKIALEVIGDTPIAVSGVLKTYGLAAALLKYGFNVVSVMADDVIPPDKAAYDGLRARGSNIRAYLPQRPANMRLRSECPDALALGFEAAYITGSRHIANVNGDHGMFGYDGVKRLMRVLTQAKSNEFELDQLMDEYGVVV
ncbi:MAG: nitrogenase component 1 [Peptococcaceae bacterium]|jgi:hypothetical protein|nr:nitrogenase component 1 [Peptococcaceae bacterium]